MHQQENFRHLNRRRFIKDELKKVEQLESLLKSTQPTSREALNSPQYLQDWSELKGRVIGLINKRRRFHDPHRINKKYTELPLEGEQVLIKAFGDFYEKGCEYSKEAVLKIAKTIIAKHWLGIIKNDPQMYLRVLERVREYRKREKEKLSDKYIYRVLSKKYSLKQVQENPQILADKRAEILAAISNGGRLKNNKPPLPDGCVLLKDLTNNENHEGYCVSCVSMQAYTCLLPKNSLCVYSSKWKGLSLRTKNKNTYLRIKVNGKTKDINFANLIKLIPCATKRYKKRNKNH